MKQKTIKIGEQEITFSTSAYVPMLYRDCFEGCDIFVDVQVVMDFYQKGGKSGLVPREIAEICEKIAYVFARHTAERNKEDFPSVKDWFMQFETFDIYFIMQDIITLWLEENATQSKQKKRTTKKQTEK